MIIALLSFNFAGEVLCTRCMGNAGENGVVEVIFVTLGEANCMWSVGNL